MKLFIALLATSLFVACASNKKTDTVAVATTTETKTEAKATTATEATKADKKTAKAAKKSVVKTEVAEATTASEVNCTSAQDARKLAIVAKNSGCELQYTKASETKTIASQIIGDAKCKEVLNSVKGKLTAANFECK